MQLVEKGRNALTLQAKNFLNEDRFRQSALRPANYSPELASSKINLIKVIIEKLDKFRVEKYIRGGLSTSTEIIKCPLHFPLLTFNHLLNLLAFSTC